MTNSAEIRTSRITETMTWLRLQNRRWRPGDRNLAPSPKAGEAHEPRCENLKAAHCAASSPRPSVPTPLQCPASSRLGCWLGAEEGCRVPPSAGGGSRALRREHLGCPGLQRGSAPLGFRADVHVSRSLATGINGAVLAIWGQFSFLWLFSVGKAIAKAWRQVPYSSGLDLRATHMAV